MGGKYSPEKQREYYRAYRKSRRGIDRPIQTAYWRNRRQKDPLARLKNNMRNRIRKFVNGAGTCGVLGCSYADLKKHLEAQFTEGMSWDNYGEWHIDHITPLASATSAEQALALCFYTNLQPLWAKANQSKGSRLPSSREVSTV